jgi:acetate kinase
MADVMLIINSGSSSIKFAIFSCQNKLNLLYHGEIESISDAPCLTILNANHEQVAKQKISSKGTEAGLQAFFKWFEHLPDAMKLKAVGHRIVHGGRYFTQPTLVTHDVIKKIADLIPLAPFHEPQNLEAIKIIKNIFPEIAQVACFDTTFHLTQEKLATLFAIPRLLTDEGIVRYGFHGISYEYIASVITQQIGDIGNKRVVVAHLGNGASMCAMQQRKSVATSMGFTALDGLMMGTRCGRIDPGVLLYLLLEKHYTARQLEHLLYSKSGLLGVSGISYDVRELLSSKDANAKEAIELFCYRAALEFGSLIAALKGCDAFVFTAGIGEHAPIIRKKICERLSWLGIKINAEANKMNSAIISENDSKILVSVIPTNEEYMIAKHTLRMVKATYLGSFK